MKPTNSLELVRQLAADESRCEFYQPVLTELPRHGLDTDELLEILRSELSDKHCYKSVPTERYHPGTVSDYYSLWIDDCGCLMFLKLLVATDQAGLHRLVITSFKKDDRNDH